MDHIIKAGLRLEIDVRQHKLRNILNQEGDKAQDSRGRYTLTPTDDSTLVEIARRYIEDVTKARQELIDAKTVLADMIEKENFL